MPKGYLCPRIEAPIAVDGRMDEDAWQLADWTADFADIQGDSQPVPRYRTRIKMLWDDDYLYVGAWLQEPHVWGTLTEHDSVIFYDNDFEVFLDPDGDRHEYYELEVNALNTTWDLRLVKPYTDGGPPGGRVGDRGPENRRARRGNAERAQRRRRSLVVGDRAALGPRWASSRRCRLPRGTGISGASPSPGCSGRWTSSTARP